MDPAVVFSFGMLAVIVAVVWIVRAVGRPKPVFCSACGHEGRPKTVTKGSLLIEIVLWCMFLVPGLIYSIWRGSSRYQACASCGNAAGLVPPDSPMARKLRGELASPAQTAET